MIRRRAECWSTVTTSGSFNTGRCAVKSASCHRSRCCSRRPPLRTSRTVVRVRRAMKLSRPPNKPRPTWSLRARRAVAVRDGGVVAAVSAAGCAAESRRDGGYYDNMKKVIVTSGWGAGYPEGGGMQWLNLHYLAGLRALGVEPFWLDMMGPSKKTEELIDAFRKRCERFGFADNWAVIQEGKQFFGMDEHKLAALCND